MFLHQKRNILKRIKMSRMLKSTARTNLKLRVEDFVKFVRMTINTAVHVDNLTHLRKISENM
jgi:hypothetical protein